jgi:hypothetical protein
MMVHSFLSGFSICMDGYIKRPHNGQWSFWSGADIHAHVAQTKILCMLCYLAAICSSVSLPCLVRVSELVAFLGTGCQALASCASTYMICCLNPSNGNLLQ